MGHEVPPDEPIEYGDDCSVCDPGKTPKYLIAVIRELTDCECLNVAPHRSYLCTGVAAAINKAWRLEQQSPEYLCLWHTKLYGSFGTVRRWSQYNCTGDHIDCNIISVSVHVGKLSNTTAYVSVIIAAEEECEFGPVVFRKDLFTIDSMCVNATNVPNQLACSDPQAIAGGMVGIFDGIFP